MATKNVRKYGAILAIVFLGSALVAQIPTPSETRLVALGASAADEYGASVSPVGDFDGDGRGDLAITAPFDDAAGLNYGFVRVVSGASGATLLNVPGTAGLRPATVAGAGDVDLDGTPDLIVGMIPLAPNAFGPGGIVRLLSGATGATLWTVAGATTNDGFGVACAGAGDLNGDGVPDVVAGTSTTPTSSLSGYVRALSGLNGALLWQRNGPAAGHRLGYSVANAGDLDLDGVSDVIAGAVGDNTVGYQNGKVYAYSGTNGATLWSSTASGGAQRLGYSVAKIGDLDLDGRPEQIVGTFKTSAGAAGYARVLSGATGAILFAPSFGVVADHFGHTVSGAGDFNGDGVPDFAIAAPDADIGGAVDVGLVRVYSGATFALLREFHGDVATRKFGFALAAASDVNGDALSDLAVGSISNATLNGLLQVLSGLAVDRFGVAPPGAGQLPLTWSSGPTSAPSQGAFTLSGATPFSQAVVGVSVGQGLWNVMGIDVLLDLTPGLWIDLPATCDAFGGVVLPVDLRLPGLSGATLCAQIVVVDPAGPFGLKASNGLRALFGP